MKTFNHYIKTICLIGSITFLTACSPHPGSGSWNATSTDNAPFTHLEVHYEAQAEFYTDDSDQEARRCFWSGITKNSINLSCVHADDTDKKVQYQMEIQEDGQGILKQGDTELMRFTRVGPPQAVNKKADT